MFRKPKVKSNIRQRRRLDSDTDEDGPKPAAPVAETPETPAAPVITLASSDEEEAPEPPGNKPAAGPKPPVLLSFDQDEGNDVEEFKIKKPSQKKRERMARRQRELEERQKAVDEAAKREEAQVKVKTSVKSVVVLDESNEVQADPELLEAIRRDAEIRTQFDGFEGIPDAQTVYAARKRREQLRIGQAKSKPAGEEGHFISTIPEGGLRQRLVREDDDNDLSENEEGDIDSGGRFYSAKALLESEEERRFREQEEFLRVERGNAGSSAEEEDGSGASDDPDEEAKRRAAESDEEFAAWERHQIRKGVSKLRVKQLRQENYATDNVKPPSEPDEVIILDEDMDIEIVDQPTKGFNVPSCSIASLDEIVAKLKHRAEDKEQFLAVQQLDLQRKEGIIKENEEFMAKIEHDYPPMRERYAFYQKMRIYVRDLLDCLNEKVTTVNAVEDRISSMWAARTDRLVKRRRADVQDEYDQCYSASAGLPWQATPETTQRTTDRTGRRTYRRIQRERAGVQAQHHDGLSSDEEEANSRLNEYTTTVADGLEAAATMFSDADEDFADLDRVLGHFVDWIMVDSGSFEAAFVPLCLPKLISVYVRVEMLDWNPLKDASKPLQLYGWYQALLRMGTDRVGFDLEYKPVVDLIPALVLKLIVPRLTKMVKTRWDPYSLSQSRNLSYFFGILVDEYPTVNSEAKEVKAFLTAVYEKLKSTIADDSFVPLLGEDAIKNTSTGCHAFLSRRYWTQIKLIQVVKCFSTILAPSVIRELVVDAVVNRSIVLALRMSPKTSRKTLDQCAALVAEIPEDWLSLKTAPVQTDFGPLVVTLRQVIDAQETGSEASAPAVKAMLRFIKQAGA